MSIKQAVLRTLGTGALLIATIPPLAVLVTRSASTPSSIILRVSLEPADGGSVSATGQP